VIIHAVIADVVLIVIGLLGKYGLTLAGIHLRSWQVIAIAIGAILILSTGLFFYRWYRTRNKIKQTDKDGKSD
jgi:uncharacterized membrane protein YjjB (DUF3815 family)